MQEKLVRDFALNLSVAPECYSKKPMHALRDEEASSAVKVFPPNSSTLQSRLEGSSATFEGDGTRENHVLISPASSSESSAEAKAFAMKLRPLSGYAHAA